MSINDNLQWKKLTVGVSIQDQIYNIWGILIPNPAICIYIYKYLNILQDPYLIKIILILTLQLSRTRSRGTHGRDHLFPLGNTGYGFVKLGNLLASRCCLLIYVAVSRGCRFVLEQPDGTSFPFHPRWQELIQYIQVALTTSEPFFGFSLHVHAVIGVGENFGIWIFTYFLDEICMYLCIGHHPVNKYLTGHHHVVDMHERYSSTYN